MTDEKHELSVVILPHRLAVARIDQARTELDESDGPFVAHIRIDGTETLVCFEEDVPTGVICEWGWRALLLSPHMESGFAISAVARVTGALANAGIAVFALSAWSVDYVLVRDERMSDAVTSLRSAGFAVVSDPPVAYQPRERG
jgi:uncharacterized protein